MNDAIGCFLGPAGMVYAIFFGFTYQAVTERLDSIARLIAAEAAQCFTILHITYTIPIENMPVAVKLHIARSVHESLVELVEQVFDNGDIPGFLQKTFCLACSRSFLIYTSLIKWFRSRMKVARASCCSLV